MLYFILYIPFSSPNDHYRLPRRNSPLRSSRSPLSRTPRNSRSPSLRRSLSPAGKRRASPLLADRRDVNRKRSSIGAVGGLLSGCFFSVSRMNKNLRPQLVKNFQCKPA